MGLLAHQHRHTEAMTARMQQVAMDTWELARAEGQTLQPGLVDLLGPEECEGTRTAATTLSRPPSSLP